MDRRDFLQWTAAGCLEAALLGLAGPVWSVPVLAGEKGRKGMALLCLKPTEPGTSKLRLYDWDTQRSTDIDVPLDLIHSLSQDRVHPNILYVFEIFGSCVRLDLKDHSIVKMDHRSLGEMSNGHGVQTSSPDLLACTEISNQKGILTLRTAKDLKRVAIAPDECHGCHQVVSLPGSSLVAVGNMHLFDSTHPKGGITFFDTEKRKVVNQVAFPIPVLHLAPLSSSEVIGLTKLRKWPNTPRPPLLTNDRNSGENINSFSAGQSFDRTPLYYAKVDGTQKTLTGGSQEKLFVDNFGLAGISSTSFLSGHFGSGKVILWRNFKIAKVFDVPRAKNLVASADGSEFMVISGETLKFFSLETLSEIRSKEPLPPMVSLASYKA